MENDVLEKIILVDDEETFLKATADLLKPHSFECDTANNATSAIGLLKENHYNLLISDIKMPGNLDLNFIKKVRAMDRQVAIIIITGYPELKTAIESVNLSVGAYLLKPMEFKDLLSHIKRVLLQTKSKQYISKST